LRSLTDPVDRPSTPESYSADRMSKYFLDLERLLNRIESASTHYQALGIERSAELQQVRDAFAAALELMYPAYSIGSAAPPQTQQRIERAFTRVSQAFTVLASFVRRREYDTVLGVVDRKQVSQPAPAPAPVDVRTPASATPASTVDTAAPRQRPSRPIDTDQLTRAQQAFVESGGAAPSSNRRRCERFKLAQPTQVTGFDRRSGKWQEMAETIDLSRTGLNLRLRKRVRNGMVLYLSLPMPIKMRSHGYAEPTYKVYGLVRRVDIPKQGSRVVGVEFLGQHPPAGFLDRPWAVYRSRRWAGGERRRERRETASEIIRLEYLAEDSQILLRQDCRTENIGRHGLRVVVKGAPVDFELVRVIHQRRALEALGSVRDRYVGPDGLERLCLQLVDKEWPF
jgi:PilZ domain-containing protein